MPKYKMKMDEVLSGLWRVIVLWLMLADLFRAFSAGN